jgi:hypothetical protein
LVQIFSSTPCSQTPSVYVPPLLSETFRKGISTANAAFKLTDCIIKSLNQKMNVGGIFCDLAKAFDCVNHEILLTKLCYFGIKGSTANCFKSYLTDIKQKIEITSPYTTQSTY